MLMRVGINTGEVVVRSIRKDDLHTDYVPVGHSTNLAARMEQLANPGTIVVSAYTHRLTNGYFAFKDLGPTQIKGVEEALNIYEVLSVGPLRTRLQVSARRGLTRFVGRQSEMEQLQQALEQAKAGHGQIVGTMGEPGLGKSRLFYEFKVLSVIGCLVLEAYSVSHGKATAYLPVIELLKGYFDIQAQDDERKRREKVTGKVLNLDRSLEDTLPYLFALLGIEEQPSPLQQMDAQIRRRRTFEALKKWLLGYPDQAVQKIHSALTLARELAHPFSLAWALDFAAWLHQYRREEQLTREQAEATITLSTEQGLAFWVAWGTIHRGWALAEQGQTEEGIVQILQGVAACRATGSELGLPRFLSLLAEAYGKGRQAEEEVSVLAEVLEVMDKTGERLYEAELYRIKGELTLAQPSVQSLGSSVKKETEECFLRAVEIARRQQAKSLELRAVMSLSRLWQQQGKKKEAHQMLSEIYNWFTEGFDTKDLQEAKVLLEELM